MRHILNFAKLQKIPRTPNPIPALQLIVDFVCVFPNRTIDFMQFSLVYNESFPVGKVDMLKSRPGQQSRNPAEVL